MINLRGLIISIHCLMFFISIIMFIYNAKVASINDGNRFLITIMLIFISLGYTYRYYRSFKFEGVTITRYLNIMALLLLAGLVIYSVMVSERRQESQIICYLILTSNIILFLFLLLLKNSKVKSITKWSSSYRILFSDAAMRTVNNFENNRCNYLNETNLSVIESVNLFDNMSNQIESHNIHGYPASSNNNLNVDNMSLINPASGMQMIDNIFDSHGNVYGTYDYDRMV
ncbi:hypothetical protein ACBQ54_18265 [Providencia vermicola]|uniref:hypothetical protein n=1 Tax=Providencia vermicola TaxID=333965 RepID=UPI002AB42CFC|nr:hypothetical protein [Providencia stuartii]